MTLLNSSYFPNYFSIEDIFASQERLHCKFEKPFRRLGFLDPTSDNEDIEVGTTIELPYWLACSLSSQRHKAIAIDTPKIYKEIYREIMKADSSVVDLHKLGMYYYELGLYITRLDLRDSPAIRAVLSQTFKDRFRQLFDWAQNSGTDPALALRLDTLEKQLFSLGRHGRSRLDSWLNEGSGQIEAAEMVLNHKKRKLTQNVDLI